MVRPLSGVPEWLDLDLLASTVPEPGWEQQGRCFGTLETDRFYPANGPQGVAATESAKRRCALCPARYPCLAAAVATPMNVDFGVWGQTSARERRRIRKALSTRDAA